MSDKILLQNMMFYGYHGAFEYEKQHGQKFFIDVEMQLDLSLPEKTDDLEQTVDYTEVYNCIKEVVETSKCNLLESIAGKIADKILIWGMITSVTVRIRKPAVPIHGQIDFVQVEITRCMR